MAVGKYLPGESCMWCGHSPAHVYEVEKRGTKLKRYAVTVTACQECAVRLGLWRND